VIAAAGHPPPAVAGPDSPARLLELPAGLPLGLGAGSVETTEVRLPPGAVLALYTDGLVETRARSLEDGITALRDALSTALARPDRTLDECCETVTQALGPHGEDDVTLVLARIQP
jgi:serine phosphatase RsbU (regulator of sigma subunit)